ncbi:hypothetical protein [Clostridium pasteurianum]|uniref:Lipoprotein n=1 Tax=Clostridium pasteurianum BC1 TaxID=86416 RepID=R4K0C6_CLOPA|nr:hypothetical protein [Clostridium pasteurianum]AGK96522.1 hypothetical protein Clopa_1596 [Clostridium pasteurianum BC1]
MRRLKTFNKTAFILLVFAIPAFLFVGCSNWKSSSPQNSTQNLVEKEPNKDQVKKSYDATLQTLVNDATITKDQAVAVLNSLMANIGNIGQESKQKQIDSLNKLVNDKVITQQQADKIINALKLNK